MISNRVFALTLPILLIHAACTRDGGTSAADSATASDGNGALTDGAASAAARVPLRPFRHAGLGGLALNAAHDLQLTDEQRTSIEQIQGQLSTGDPGSRTAYQDFQSHLAADIRSAKFDAAQLHADYAAFDATRRAEQDREADALNALHATLDANQRTALVAAVRTRQAAVDGQKLPELPDGGVSDRAKQTLTHMTQDLTLDPGQQKRVSDLLAKDERTTILAFPVHKEEQKKHVDAFVASFEEAQFDAKTLDGVDGGGASAPHEQMEKEVTFLSKLDAILKPDQREKLAAQRTPGPQGPHHMMGPGGMGPGGMPGGPAMMGPGGPGGPGMMSMPRPAHS